MKCGDKSTQTSQLSLLAHQCSSSQQEGDPCVTDLCAVFIHLNIRLTLRKSWNCNHSTSEWLLYFILHPAADRNSNAKTWESSTAFSPHNCSNHWHLQYLSFSGVVWSEGKGGGMETELTIHWQSFFCRFRGGGHMQEWNLFLWAYGNSDEIEMIQFQSGNYLLCHTLATL